MTVVLDLSEELGTESPFSIPETNQNMRKVWLMEKELTEVTIIQTSKKSTIAKKEKYIKKQQDLMYTLIDFLIDILDLNPLEFKDYFFNEVSYFDILNASTKITGAILHIDPIQIESDPIEEKEYKKRLKERYFFLDNAVKDFDYNELQILTNLHIAPSQFENEDYYRMNEVLSALSPDERPMTGSGFLNRLNMSRDEANDALAKK